MAHPQQRPPSGGISRATVKKLIKQFAKGGAPVRAILPVFDTVATPGLAYKSSVIDDADVIVIQGENLEGITEVDVSTDVNVSGNGGPSPTIVGVVVLDTSITVTLDGTASNTGDMWGIILRDGDGNVYGAPSPLTIWAPL